MTNKYFVKKNLKLSMDFDTCIAKHPAILNKIPNKSLVVFTVSGDKNFNNWSTSLITKHERNRAIEARKEGNSWNVRKLEFA